MAIYVMTNPSMPRIVKIGISVAPEVRRDQLSSSSGCPTPFVLEYVVNDEDDFAVERATHEALASCRVSPSREFFRTSVSDAVNAISAVIQQRETAAREVAEIIAEHVPAEWWDGVKANLYAAGAKNIADALTNITGQSVMDRRYA